MAGNDNTWVIVLVVVLLAVFLFGGFGMMGFDVWLFWRSWVWLAVYDFDINCLDFVYCLAGKTN
jgi:hypothetical protein